MIDRDLSIQTCHGTYTCTDTARHHGVSKTTVRRLWALIEDRDALPEPPNITGTKVTADLILADTRILLDRGHTLEYVATHFGVSPERIRRTHRDAGISYSIRDDAGVYAA